MNALLLLFAALLQPAPLTLQSVFETAAAGHPSARRQELAGRQARLQYEKVRGEVRPQVWLEADMLWQSDVTQVPVSLPGMNIPQPRQDRISAALKASQRLYDGGLNRTRAGLELAAGEASARSAEADWLAFRTDLAGVYFQILLADARIASQRLLVQDLAERTADLQHKVKAGALLASAAWIMEAEWLRARQLEAELKAGRKASVETLNRLLGTAYPDTIAVQVPEPSAAPDESAGNRPEWKIFSAQDRAASARMELAAQRNRPQVNGLVTAGYGRPGLNQFDPDFAAWAIAGVQLRWSLYDGAQQHRERQAASIDRELVENRREQFKRGLDGRLARLSADLERIDAQLQLDAGIVELKEKIVAQFTTRLNNGAITSTELVNELTALYQARLQQNIHAIQRMQNLTETALALGTL